MYKFYLFPVHQYVFMTSLVNGTDPTKVQCDQKAMRKHYINCLLCNRLSEFPTNADQTVSSVRRCNEISGEYPVLKSCRLPEIAGDLITCSKCGVDFHQECVGMQSLAVILWEKWMCSNCTN